MPYNITREMPKYFGVKRLISSIPIILASTLSMLGLKLVTKALIMIQSFGFNKLGIIVMLDCSVFMVTSELSG